MRSTRAFTLVELMIAVGIISVLASIAIPSFLQYLKSARAAEAPLIMRGIADAEISFFKSQDRLRRELRPIRVSLPLMALGTKDPRMVQRPCLGLRTPPEDFR